MRHWQGLRIGAFCVALGALAMPARAITVTIDYTYDQDTGNFFGSGNPQGAAAGAQARAALDAAAAFFTNILNDSFSAITLPSPYHSTFPGSTGVVTWTWQQHFQHPSTGGSVQVVDPNIPANQYIIYTGARSLADFTAGVGAVGGYGWSNQLSGDDAFTQGDNEAMAQISSNFDALLERRGEPSGFAAWGGTVAFDNDPSPPWHFNHTTTPPGNARDFYSVAIHELGHALGFGTQVEPGASEWEALVSGSSFIGSNARALNGGNPVPLNSDLAHWAQGTMSRVYGSTTMQEAAMDPDIQNGMRKRFTELDAAALRDIGWELIPLPGLFGDYNNNGVVDAADYVMWRDRNGQNVSIPNDQTPGTVTASDYTVWRANFGKTLGFGTGIAIMSVPEPAGAVLAIIGGLATFVARRKRRG